MERYIAIDNVCAWPNLTLLPSGNIAAIIFNQPFHGRFEGEAECWISTDGGRLWKKAGVPIPHKPGENRLNVSAGLARDGALVVICSGSTPVVPLGAEEIQVDYRKILPPVVCRSYDEGRTWTHSDSVEIPAGIDRFIPFGDIIQCPGGFLGTSFYAVQNPELETIQDPYIYTGYFLRSYDDGYTWVEPTIIGEPGREGEVTHNETALLSIGEKKIMAAVRTSKIMCDQHTNIYISEDSGRTWKYKGPVTLAKQHPAHILMLEDGTLLLTYGIRNKPFCGVGARISIDGGERWSSPVFLVNFETATDCGYPSSVQLEDGTIVTAYYCKTIPCHNRYHMGVTRWKLEELF